MTQKEKLSRMDREVVKLLGRAIDTAIKYGDEINFVTKNKKLTYPYQEKMDFDAEKQLSRSRDLSDAMDYVFNLPLGKVDRAELSSCKIEDMLMLNLTISVKTSEGNRDFTLAHEECSLSSIVTKRTIRDNDIMSYLFFRENFSDSLLKPDIEYLTEEQFADVLENCLEQSVPTGFIKAIFPKFKEAAIAKNIMTQADALNFIFDYTERDLFISLYEYKDMDPWDAKIIAKRPSEMDCCVNIHDNFHFYGGWFYWPCLDPDKED